MLIGWGTPFNYRSAIGKFSRAVGEELCARGHEVVMVRLETGPELALAPLETDLPITSADRADVDAFDELIVNFGNHAPYHSQCVSLLARRAPLGIFHDAEMRDFVWGLGHRHGVELPHLTGITSEVGSIAASELVAPEARPVLASLAAMCWGAVIHGPHYRETVAAYCPGPVEVLPLCYPDTAEPREPGPRSAQPRVVIFGVITEHKQPRRVMHALAAIKERIGTVELHLAGAIEDRYLARLLRESRKLGIPEPVIHGFLPDQDLDALIESAHAVCVLRYPVTEGGSASLATALYRQRPLILADVASYAMVPDEFAYKVSYGEDHNDVAEALMKIFDEPEVAETRAREAGAWAQDQFAAQTYADALLPILEGRRPAATLARLARHLVPAVTDPQHRAMPSVLPDLAGVLDWMNASQANG